MPDAAVAAPPAELALVRSILRRFVPDREVWAFGSRVRGTARRHSDLDLAILGEARLPLATLASLRTALEESPVSFPVDLVEWAAASEGFRAIIEEGHVVLQRAARDASRVPPSDARTHQHP